MCRLIGQEYLKRGMNLQAAEVLRVGCSVDPNSQDMQALFARAVGSKE